MLDSCGSGATVLKANGSARELTEVQGKPEAFTSAVIDAFGEYLSSDSDLESNAGELLKKRFYVLAACEFGKTSSDIYYTKKNNKAIIHRGGTFTYSLLKTMGCSYPGGKLSGSKNKLTLKQAFDGIKSTVKSMNKTITSQPYFLAYPFYQYYSDVYYDSSLHAQYMYDDDGKTKLYFYECYDEDGYLDYGFKLTQSVRMGGTSDAVIFK